MNHDGIKKVDRHVLEAYYSEAEMSDKLPGESVELTAPGLSLEEAQLLAQRLQKNDTHKREWRAGQGYNNALIFTTALDGGIE